MKRDFSEAYKQKLIQMIRQNENEKWCDFTDWLGDRLLDFSDWIGLLDLYGSISGAEAYTIFVDQSFTVTPSKEAI